MKSHGIECNTYDLLDRLSMYLKYFNVEQAFVNYLTDILRIRFHDEEEMSPHLVKLICNYLRVPMTKELYNRISLYYSVVMSMGRIKMSLPDYVTSFLEKEEILYPNSTSELRKIAPTYNQRVLLMGLVREDPLGMVEKEVRREVRKEEVVSRRSIRVLLSVFGRY